MSPTRWDRTAYPIPPPPPKHRRNEEKIKNLQEHIKKVRSELKDIPPPPELPHIDPQLVSPQQAVRLSTQWRDNISSWSITYDSKARELEALLQELDKEQR